MKVDDSGKVTSRLELRKKPLSRSRYEVREKRVGTRDTIDSRFDERRSPFKWEKLGPRNISVIYLWALTFLVFALWVPDTWFQLTTIRSILNQDAVRAIVALGLVIPLSAGAFDLSIGGSMSAAGITSAWAMVDQGWPVWAGVLLAVGLGVLIGAVNGFLVVKIRIDSLIATLGMASILVAYSSWLAKGRSITGLPDGFKGLTGIAWWGLEWTLVYLVLIALAMWFVIEHTPLGRYLFATGGGREAARLAGVHTDRFVFGSLVASATIAALGGVLITSKIASGTPNVGAAFLLPAFAAAFFGATQFKQRFNVWGTVLAVFVLASGVKGLQLAGVTALWVDSLFFGVALIVAVGLTTYRRKVYGGERRWWKRGEAGPDGFLGRVLGWDRPRTEQSKANVDQWWYDPADREGHHHKP